MSKIILVDSGDLTDLPFAGHESAEVYDLEAKEVGACVADADKSLIWRATLPAFAAAVTKSLEEISGITRGVDQAATDRAKSRAKDADKVKPVAEKFVKFVGRIKAQFDPEDKNEDSTWLAVVAKAREVAATTAVDASPSSRAAKGPSKQCYAKAENILAREADAMETAISTLADGITGGFEVERDEDGKPTLDSVASLVDAFLKSV